MFQLVESEKEKRIALKDWKKSFVDQLPEVNGHTLTSPGGKMETSLYTAGEGNFYAALDIRREQSFFAFGVYIPNRTAQYMITQINVPLGDNRKSVAGFFAKDPDTGKNYLFHSGKVGGGAEGVGKTNFLTWTNLKLHKVQDQFGEVQDGILIGEIGSKSLLERTYNFVRQVQEFKEAMKNGEQNRRSFLKKREITQRYLEEFSGKKKRGKLKEVEYISYHGDVVDALKNRLEKTGIKAFSTQFIDLYTASEIYEVKSTLDRQAIYTAIGQLLTHRLSLKNPDAEMYIVLPRSSRSLPKDIGKSLSNLRISTINYTIERNKVNLG